MNQQLYAEISGFCMLLLCMVHEGNKQIHTLHSVMTIYVHDSCTEMSLCVSCRSLKQEVVVLTLGWKTASISQDIPVDKEPGGSKLQYKSK